MGKSRCAVMLHTHLAGGILSFYRCRYSIHSNRDEGDEERRNYGLFVIERISMLDRYRKISDKQ